MLFLYAYDCINDAEWHWLRFHYSMLPPHPTALQIAAICASLERALPGLGKQLVDSIASLKTGRNTSQITGRCCKFLLRCW